MFKVNVDSESNWMEYTNTFEEAVNLIRGLMEADGKTHYIRTNNWTHASKSKNASCQILWTVTNGNTAKTVSKTIQWINYVDECPEMIEARKRREAKEEELKRKWRETVALFR